MANIIAKPQMELTATFSFNEIEIRALDALTGYDFDHFIKVFYECMGSHYMKPNEEGLRSLFACIRREVPTILSQIEQARNIFEGKEE